MMTSSKKYKGSPKILMGMALRVENRLAYSLAQKSHPISPDADHRDPRDAGNFGDPRTVSNQFFSGPSVDSRARRARARDEWSKEKWQKRKNHDHHRQSSNLLRENSLIFG
jgi:hypothetical protein